MSRRGFHPKNRQNVFRSQIGNVFWNLSSPFWPFFTLNKFFCSHFAAFDVILILSYLLIESVGWMTGVWIVTFIERYCTLRRRRWRDLISLLQSWLKTILRHFVIRTHQLFVVTVVHRRVLMTVRINVLVNYNLSLKTCVSFCFRVCLPPCPREQRQLTFALDADGVESFPALLARFCCQFPFHFLSN